MSPEWTQRHIISKNTKTHTCGMGLSIFGGGGGIRTHDGRETMPVFKTGAFNRSATPPS